MPSCASAFRSACRLLVLSGAFLVAGSPGLARARAQPICAGAVGERSGAGPLRPTHGWLAIPDGSGAMLIHVPPRSEAGWNGGKARGSQDGTVRKAVPLDRVPSAIAAMGERVYLVFDQRTVAGEPVRRSVSSLVARPSAVGDYWYFEPEGRLTAHPALPPTGLLRALAGTPVGLAALIDDGPSANPGGSVRLFVLGGDRWAPVALPATVDPARVFLFGERRGLALLLVGQDGRADLWIGERPRPDLDARSPPPRGTEPDRTRGAFEDDQGLVLSRRPASDELPLELEWRRRGVGADGSVGLLDLARTDVVSVGGVLTAVTARSDGSAVVTTLTPASSYEVARAERVGADFAAVPLDVPGRLALVWITPDAAPGVPRSGKPAGAARSQVQVREISVYTGRILWSGPARGDTPVSPREVQLLAGALVAVTTVVLLLILRREADEGVYSLPDGTALAEPGRRLMAWSLDLGMVLAVACRIWNTDFSELLMPTGFVSGQTLWVIATALGLGFAAGTLCEWLTGRTPGKLLAGCEVIDVRSGVTTPRHPRFWQCVVRNAIKWLVPPVVVLGLLDARRRHRGDSFARSAVVIRVENEDSESADQDS